MDISQTGGGQMADQLQIVSFKLGDEEFAVDILKIQEINRMAEITKVPNSPDFIEGVINLRGKIIPVVDLRRRLGMTREKRDKHTRIVVMEISGKIVGFIVDSVSEVLRFPCKMIEPPPAMMAGLDAEYIDGVGKLEDRLLILIDMARVLKEKEIEIIDKKATPPPEKAAGEGGKAVDGPPSGGMDEVDREIRSAIDEVSNQVVITREDLEKLANHIKGMLDGNFYQDDLELYGELGDLARYINNTRKSLRTFDAAEIAEQDLPAASDQLEGIVEATEDATNKILTASETMLDEQGRIMKAVELIKSADFAEESEAKRAEAIKGLEGLYQANNAGLMEIISACNFQDLTGQRIQKIISLVSDIESKIMQMILSFNIKRQEKRGHVNNEIINKEKKMLAKIEEGLELKGPQRIGKGINQEDVDNLLDDLFG